MKNGPKNVKDIFSKFYVEVRNFLFVPYWNDFKKHFVCIVQNLDTVNHKMGNLVGE